MKNYILSATFFLIFTQINAFTQDWFPMEVGNRWDYNITIYSHGGNWSHLYGTTKIVEKEDFGTEKDYYIFSSIGIFNHKILRIENDSLYAFIIEDSTECLLLAFNLEDSIFYPASCLEDSVAYLYNTNGNYFGFPDSQQSHGSGYIIYEISKKFGFVFSDDFRLGGLSETWYYLSGCIISDTIYGVLLDIEELTNDNHITFQLHQNFPNPFNPTTNIEFRIADFGFVSLKVYDVLGNEVATLVNEVKQAGEYEVEFTVGQDSSPDIASGISAKGGYASGVYFYQLTAGDFIQTKKMVLLK